MTKKFIVYTAGSMELSKRNGIDWRRELDRIVEEDEFLSAHLVLLHPEIPSKVEEDTEYLKKIKSLEETKLAFQQSLNPLLLNSNEYLNDILPNDITYIQSSHALAIFFDKGAASSTGTVSEMSIACALGIPYYTLLNSSLKDKDCPMRTWSMSALSQSRLLYTGDREYWSLFLRCIVKDLLAQEQDNAIYEQLSLPIDSLETSNHSQSNPELPAPYPSLTPLPCTCLEDGHPCVHCQRKVSLT